jgi:peptidyl-prolyl cis-trans isomerase B (cyclophilin B)
MGNILLMKKATSMKHLVVTTLIGMVLASTSALATAVTATPKAATVTCKATKAVAHAPIKVTPPVKILPVKMGTFTLVTNCGNIVIATNGIKAQVTLRALTALAKAGYFDASLCHRLTTSGLYVFQCGDPTATGRGGPGFTFRDENLPKARSNNYPAGTVAMANSGANTNGSQFFLVYANTTLPPSYTIWGKITSGLNILKGIAAAGVKGGITDGMPAKKIAIEKVIVK